MMPFWVFIAERVQEVHPVEGSEDMCEVRQWESMSGPASYLMKYVMGVPDQVHKLSMKYLEELKAFIEKDTN